MKRPETGLLCLPEKAQVIFDRAAEYGNNRVIAGVHFPTDVEAGKMSAAVIVNALVQQPLFVRDFERANIGGRAMKMEDGGGKREVRDERKVEARIAKVFSSDFGFAVSLQH